MQAKADNEVWTVAFKGWWRSGEELVQASLRSLADIAA